MVDTSKVSTRVRLEFHVCYSVGPGDYNTYNTYDDYAEPSNYDASTSEITATVTGKTHDGKIVHSDPMSLNTGNDLGSNENRSVLCRL